MKINIVKKIFISIIMISVIFSLFNIKSEASTIKNTIDSATNWVENPEEVVNFDIEKMSDLMYNLLLIIGIIVAVIIGMVVGIKFMTGGIEEKAKVKETLIPYIAGCVVIFGAFTIWKLIVTILQSTN